MGKKIVVLTGSPRKNGNSFAMTESFINAAKEKLRSLTGVKYGYENSEISYIVNNLKDNYII